MRTKYQMQVRKDAAELANELLIWLSRRNPTSGNKAHEHIIHPFAIEKNIDRYVVWHAWDLLKDAGRRKAMPGARWEIVSFKPVVLDSMGDPDVIE